MKIICDKHGEQQAIEISADLLPIVSNSEPCEVKRMRIRVTFPDEYFWDVVLSEEFCKKHNIAYNDVVYLGDDFPVWYKALTPVCRLCAVKRLNIVL